MLASPPDHPVLAFAPQVMDPKKQALAEGDDLVGTTTPEQDMSYGVLPPSALEGLQVMLTDLYMPLISAASSSWQKVMGAEDSTAEFFSNYKKFSETLSEAVSSLQGGFTLRRPERLFDIENKVLAGPSATPQCCPSCHSSVLPSYSSLLALLPLLSITALA